MIPAVFMQINLKEGVELTLVGQLGQVQGLLNRYEGAWFFIFELSKKRNNNKNKTNFSRRRKQREK